MASGSSVAAWPSWTHCCMSRRMRSSLGFEVPAHQSRDHLVAQPIQVGGGQCGRGSGWGWRWRWRRDGHWDWGRGGRASMAISTCSAMTCRSWVLIRATRGSTTSARRAGRMQVEALLDEGFDFLAAGPGRLAGGGLLDWRRAPPAASPGPGWRGSAPGLSGCARRPRPCSARRGRRDAAAWAAKAGSSWEVHMTTGMRAVSRLDLRISRASKPFIPGMV